MDLNPIQAALYTWHINSDKGFLNLLKKTGNAIGAFFTAIFGRFTVSEFEQDNYLSVDWRKNTYPGKAMCDKKISERVVTLADNINQIGRVEDPGITSIASKTPFNNSQRHVYQPSVVNRNEVQHVEDVSEEKRRESSSLNNEPESVPFKSESVGGTDLVADPELKSEQGSQEQTSIAAIPFKSESVGVTDFVADPELKSEQGSQEQTSIAAILPSLSTTPSVMPGVLNTSPVSVQAVQQGSRSLRAVFGGKGMFLQHMSANGIPVPEFRLVGIPDILLLEKAGFAQSLLPEALSSIELPSAQGIVSLDQLKERIARITNPEEQDRLLKALSGFLESDAFYNAIKNHSTAYIMRNRFKALCADHPEQKVIIRSSGAKEDDYGDAQAGKYESYVHGADDVVQTCLKVMASGYRPEVCKNGMPTTLSLVMQHCVDCQFGGVAMSYTSLKDNRMQIEYVPGQPKGAVSGLGGLTPHRYTITRKNHQPALEHIRGDVAQAFYLENQGGNEAIERLTDLPPSEEKTLPEPTAKALYEIMVKLENLLQCPVDVEFGVNRQNQVQILQVRPVTRLQGGAQFSVGVPSEAIVKGTLVSEGLCKGPVVLVKVGDNPENIPDNAIIVAHHGEDWMLAPDVLGKVSGFVFEQGGTGDHVAITLRQAGKPCFIADDKPVIVDGNIATLACGEFNGQSGGFLLSGEQAYEHYQANSLPAASADFSAAIARTTRWQPTRCDEKRVDHQFKWLNGQNTRLLQYFDRDALINRCLSPEGAVLISMSPQRHQILRSLKDEVSHFLSDTDALLQGYGDYLNEGSKGEETPPKIKSYLQNLETLKTRSGEIKAKVNTGLDRITKGLLDGNELLQKTGDFSQWQTDCQDLKNSLQALSQPRTADQVRSIHDTVFLVHKSFVDILAEVANGSGHGEVVKKSNRVTFVNFNTPGMTQLLDDQCASALENYGHHNTVLNMDGVSIISTDINYHKGVIELIDKGAGSQGRLMRLRMIDNFKDTRSHYEGKFKRFLWLALLLNNIGKQNSSQGVQIKLNEEMGEIVVEVNNIPDIERMRQQLIAAMTVMNSSTNKDNRFCFVTEGLASVQDFPALRTYLNRIQDANSRLMSKALIFRETLMWPEGNFTKFLEVFFPEGSDEVNLIHFAQKVGKLDRDKAFVVDSKQSFQRDVEQIRFLLIEEPKKVLDSVGKYSDWLENKEQALPLVTLNGKLLEHLSPSLKQDRDIVMAAATHTPAALKHGDKAFWNDREILSAAAHANSIEYSVKCKKLSRNAMLELFNLPVDGKFKFYTPFNMKPYSKDAEIMLAGIKHNVGYLRDAAESLTGDTDFMKKAIQINVWAYSYASDRIKCDPSIAAMALQLSNSRIEDLYDDVPEALKQRPEIKTQYIEGLQRCLEQVEY
ncbi:PEP/pyruvate-binding domain-containing protein [Endozoicomonas ascidiicola]|uniref:PEP/pyruvate-binding domain-containing protein n=1 Tax=Endozoicomonas ascidiicola TaxID=1698521 RepID=UPI00082D7150|nr:PEP/pyruvate-binding domain-containing protein [Endozoicomonas ascidiicola]